MRGYGLTTFRGTAPESFVVEAVGVLKNSFPKQDLVIVHMDDPKLVESNIVAGMSGSPIYFEGRLLGALAYGPLFPKKAIGYVTPIQNMLSELDRPAEPDPPRRRLSMRAPAGDHGPGPYRETRAGMVPVESPLSVSGFSGARLKLIEDWFAPFGLVPVASGAASGDPTAGPTRFVPGASIGVQLMTGDKSMTAVGTVTHVDGKGRVLAFGHPFLNIGQTAMPAATVRIHMHMPSVARSYVLASPIRSLGSMVQDRQPAILIDPNRMSPMVPVSVSVENAVTGRREEYRYRVIRESVLTPMLTFFGLAESIDVAEGQALRDRVYDIQSRISLAGRADPIDLSDVTPSAYKTLFDLMSLLENNIEEAVPVGFDFNVKISNASKIAWIIGARAADRRFGPSDRVPVTVRLRTQDSREFERTVGFTLPADVRGQSAFLEIRGGFGFSQPEARPESLEQIVNLLTRRPRGTDLLVRLLQGTPSVAESGVVLSDLPVFYRKILQGGVQGVSQPIVQLPYESFSGEHLLLGSQRVQIELMPEGRPR
ncbi:hypothetical protein HY522_06520 [bacterium]|nr:hypothetical protein [bacterium]